MLKQIGDYLLKITSTYSSKTVVRHKRNIAKQQYKKRTSLNPGIQRQSQLLHDNESYGTAEVDDLESLESDFMNVGDTYREHIQQVERLKEQEKLLIVKQKYFKETFPNFLSWNDKKQIQYLHGSNPDEWTIEKLSDGFPALPETIKKVVKATWTKKDVSKVLNHDNSVKRNWELFKKGKLNLPPNLTNHLNRFTDRNYEYTPDSIVKDIEIKKSAIPKSSGEFSDIIRSYKYNNREEVDGNKNSQTPENSKIRKPKDGMYLTSENVDQSSHTTLAYLRTTLKNDVDFGKELEGDDKILLNPLNNTQMMGNIENEELPENSIIDLKDVTKSAYLSTEVSSKKDEKHLMYPEKIMIPKDKLRADCTYKLNDCYYDTDGLFLYRVPGMDK